MYKVCAQRIEGDSAQESQGIPTTVAAEVYSVSQGMAERWATLTFPLSAPQVVPSTSSPCDSAVITAVFVLNLMARSSRQEEKRAAPCHWEFSSSWKIHHCLLPFSDTKNELISILRMEPKEKEKKNKQFGAEFHDINTKIKEEMQKEDKEITVSELSQILPVAVPVPRLPAISQ